MTLEYLLVASIAVNACLCVVVARLNTRVAVLESRQDEFFQRWLSGERPNFA